MQELMDLQLTMFLMILVGAGLKKTGLVGDEGQKNLNDMVIYVILPCNIVRSFMVEFRMDIITSFAEILVISICIQMGCTILGKVLYKGASESQRKCLHYATICSNAGFLGNPIAEGVFGTFGLTLASIYLIPQRIVMWSAGISVFTQVPEKKKLFKKVMTHPCIIACMVGVVLMVTNLQLPSFLTASLQSLSNCNTAMCMMVIGMILAEMDLRSMLDKLVLKYVFFRLLIIPVLVLIPCMLLQVDKMVMGVSVLLAAMPAGATTSILAAKYEGDAPFATKLVIVSTVISLVTTPIWSMILT